jgi:hypothetical protein
MRSVGSVKLAALTASDVQPALVALAPRLSTRTLQIAHNVLVRAIRQAEREDLVGATLTLLLSAHGVSVEAIALTAPRKNGCRPRRTGEPRGTPSAAERSPRYIGRSPIWSSGYRRRSR